MKHVLCIIQHVSKPIGIVFLSLTWLGLSTFIKFYEMAFWWWALVCCNGPAGFCCQGHHTTTQGHPDVDMTPARDPKQGFLKNPGLEAKCAKTIVFFSAKVARPTVSSRRERPDPHRLRYILSKTSRRHRPQSPHSLHSASRGSSGVAKEGAMVPGWTRPRTRSLVFDSIYRKR